MFIEIFRNLFCIFLWMIYVFYNHEFIVGNIDLVLQENIPRLVIQNYLVEMETDTYFTQ